MTYLFDDETPQQRQTGYRPPPRTIFVSSLAYDPVWAETVKEYFRLKAQGVSREAALRVFNPLLGDPERASAAALMLATAAPTGHRSGKPRSG